MRRGRSPKREHVRANGREEPLGNRGRRKRRAVEQEDQLIVGAGNRVHPTKIAAHEEHQLAEQRRGSRLTDLAPHRVDTLDKGRTDDNAARGGSVVSERR